MLTAPQLNTVVEYRARFANADYWKPYVQYVCQRHGLEPCDSIRCEVPGTYPTFIVDDRWVVKFFGQLFDGPSTFCVELEANHLIAQHGQVPAPPVLASDDLLGPDAVWRWPYIIFEYVPAKWIGPVFDAIGNDDRIEVAKSLGTVTRQMHNTDLSGAVTLRPTWDTYSGMLQGLRSDCAQRHAVWGTTPNHLIAQIDRFLLPTDALVPSTSAPVLVHADITSDHVLGSTVAGRWRFQWLIDFGDAIAGAREYEMLPLHLDVFHCNKALLGAYLAAYGIEAWQMEELPRVATSLALLHRFNVLASVFQRFPMAAELSTLEALSQYLWNT